VEDNNLTKSKKSEIIEQLLDEVGLSAQDLIDLLANFTEVNADIKIDSQTMDILVNDNSIDNSFPSLPLSDFLLKLEVSKDVILANKLGLEIKGDEIFQILAEDEVKKLRTVQFAQVIKDLSKTQLIKLKSIVEDALKQFSKETSKKTSFLTKFSSTVKDFTSIS